MQGNVNGAGTVSSDGVHFDEIGVMLRLISMAGIKGLSACRAAGAPL